MEKHEIKNQGVGLEKRHEDIKLLIPQCPPSFSDETNTIQCLRCFLRGIIWAQKAMFQISAVKLSLNRFVVALGEGLQLAEETGHMQLVDTHFQRYRGIPPKTRTIPTINNN